MTKVVLLGDSIRMNYAPYVPELLGEGYEIWQPAENCRFSHYTLRGLFDWRAQMEGCDIVHWNNGLWDQCDLFDDGPFTDPDEYVKTMLRIAGILKKRAKVVIFATTTPVRPDNPHDANPRIDLFNSLIVPKLEAEGILIDDLNALVKENLNENIRETDKLHLTETGAKRCAEQAAASIRSAAELLS